MEEFAKKLRSWLRGAAMILTPHFRQVVRFLLLPYCYLFLVNWSECRKSRLRVAMDLLYMFFVLRNFPDNYSPCRLYEKPRAEWAWYYGSGYNPYQRARLTRAIAPTEYQVIFEDKEVCHQICVGAGLRVPRLVGVIDPARPARLQLEQFTARSPATEHFAKPARGTAGQHVIRLVRGQGRLVCHGTDRLDDPLYRLPERYVVQEKIEQHAVVAAVFPHAINTMRVMTLLAGTGESIVIAAVIRFGTGDSHVDNWSRGGIAAGIDVATGSLLGNAFDKKGRIYAAHPDTRTSFRDFRIPMWEDILAFSRRTQACFPYFRLLGLDVALAPDGPLLVEVNAYPDLVFLEQTTGPLLKNPRVYTEFSRYGLFINGRQKALRDANAELLIRAT